MSIKVTQQREQNIGNKPSYFGKSQQDLNNCDTMMFTPKAKKLKMDSYE